MQPDLMGMKLSSVIAPDVVWRKDDEEIMFVVTDKDGNTQDVPTKLVYCGNSVFGRILIKGNRHKKKYFVDILVDNSWLGWYELGGELLWFKTEDAAFDFLVQRHSMVTSNTPWFSPAGLARSRQNG